MGRVAPEARAVCGSYNPAAANLSHTVHTFRFSMPLPGDTHAYELTHLRYMLHPVVESAAEASFLVGDQFRARLLTLAALASSDTEPKGERGGSGRGEGAEGIGGAIAPASTRTRRRAAAS